MPDVPSPKAKQRLRIGFVHRYDARNIRSWSGTFWFMSRALEAHVGEVVYLGPDDSYGTKFIIDNLARVNRVWQKLTGKIFVTDKNRFLANRLARFFERRLVEAPCDILFAPVASTEIAYLKTNLPIVYYSDITWVQIVDYYPDYSSVSGFCWHEGQRIESAAITRSKAAVYPSQWAVDSARKDYGAEEQATFKISFGANLVDPPTRAEALDRTLGSRINLLLIGVDWERKGGPIAFECLTSLLERNVDAHLTICGCVPPPGFEHPRMRVIPFLSKNDPAQQLQIEQLFREAHFMLLPTRAEALGIVTCEASAFGLPTIGTDTGGVRGTLQEGVNGYLLPFEARGRAFADKIISIISDPSCYRTLVVSSRDEYERVLNWDTWGRSMRAIMENVLGHSIDPGNTLTGTIAHNHGNHEPSDGLPAPQILVGETTPSLVGEETL
jgi:glycosyltransferase involved in cell wall biosynthesis